MRVTIEGRVIVTNVTIEEGVIGSAVSVAIEEGVSVANVTNVAIALYEQSSRANDPRHFDFFGQNSYRDGLKIVFGRKIPNLGKKVPTALQNAVARQKCQK